jgi:choline dehydrogenase-like flavoprotein
MLRSRDSSITKQLTWMNMLVSGAALLLACVAFAAYELVVLRQSMIQSLSVQAQIVGLNSVSALLFNDRHSAQDTLAALKAARHIISAGIYKPDGQPFAGYSRDRGGRLGPLPQVRAGQPEVYSFKGGQLVMVRAIIFEGKPTGTVVIRSDLEEMKSRLMRYGVIGALVLSTCLLAVAMISSLLRRTIAEPIVSLAETAKVVSREKNYSVRAAETGRQDEMGVLIDAFNEMLAEIQARDSDLQPGFLLVDSYSKVLARPENRVTVDTDHKDAYGIPVPVVHFKFCDNDRALWNEMKEKAREILDLAKCKLIVDTNPTPIGFSSHEVGTVRMGNDPRTSVLNAFNQAREVKNLFVTDGSCFTTFPEKNPTLTIMALAVRAARHMTGETKKGNL